ILLASGPSVSSQDVEEPVIADSAFANCSTQKVVVLVVDPSRLADEAWVLPSFKPQAERAVLTVFTAGTSPSAQPPSDTLRAINAEFWTESITESVPAILSLSGLTLEDQRIFNAAGRELYGPHCKKVDGNHGLHVVVEEGPPGL